MKRAISSNTDSLAGLISAFSLLTGVFLLLGILLFPPGTQAQQLGNDDDLESGLCEPNVDIVTELKTTGTFLPGSTIGIRADPLRIKVLAPPPLNPHICGVSSRPVPPRKWSWEIVGRPVFSTSQLTGTNTTSVSLVLDRVGLFRIRFTACPSGCSVTLPDQTTVTVGPLSRQITIRVAAILPPEKSPVLPASAQPSPAPTPSIIDDHCSWSSDAISAAWYTVRPWSGAADYEILEGVVKRSKVASADNGLNHDSQDWTVDVEPDPKYRKLLNRRLNFKDVEIEWERVQLDLRARPTENDRVSAIGYWVYDCGHSAKTEIHPPVLLAVHRPRAILLPTSAGAGSNVYVPGIITDVWVNTKGGATTEGCHSLGLHQQIDPTKPTVDAHGNPIIRCLPESEGFSSNPISRQFQFNIYLPKSPQAAMAAIGRTAPPVPLYWEVVGGPQQRIFIEPITEGDVTYLRVTLDMIAYPYNTYYVRIVSGWAHAAPDNWGAQRWNFAITSLNITDDADSAGRGDGDWRFWANTNTATNTTDAATEWTTLFDCDDCAHGTETFSNTSWRVVLFPNQYIWLATSGFEDDWTLEDSIASLRVRLSQMPIAGVSFLATDGGGQYRLNYEVRAGTELGPAILSDTARARYDAYRLVNNDLHGVSSETLAQLEATFSSTNLAPLTVQTHEERDSEPRSIEQMGAQQVRQLMERAQGENPAKLDRFLRELEGFVQKGKVKNPGEVNQFLQALKPAVPSVLWQRHGFEAHLRTTRN